MTAPTTAAAVANAFLDIQECDSDQFPRIDQMKLQKLLYYAHAWWLAHKGEELFSEDIEAWPWGPVVRDIYGQFRDFGRRPISGKRATELRKIGDGFLDFQIGEPSAVEDEVKEFLQSIWNAHKNFTGIQLSNSTHMPGEPWTIMRDQFESLDNKPRIPNELIRDVYRSKISAA
ncbi:MAG: type II toxin-antitoxin system antitoxin SocA domain-containing protein [Stappiaceae bacterium]